MSNTVVKYQTGYPMFSIALQVDIEDNLNTVTLSAINNSINIGIVDGLYSYIHLDSKNNFYDDE